MKKVMMMALAVVFVFASASAYAGTVKEAVKDASEKSGNFWAREGERSGLRESTSSWGQFWTRANPVTFFQDQQSAYNARKGSMTK